MEGKVEFYRETEFKDTEIGRIPKDWEAIRFGDIVNLVKGRRPREFANERIRDSLPYLSAENLRNNNIVQFVKVSGDIILVDEGDLILIWDGSNAGEFFLGKRGVLSSTMVKILLKEKLYHGRFLFYLLKTKENYLKDQTKGTGIPHVDGTILRSLVIPLPPLEEQQKIAEILSNIDRAIQKTDEIIDKTESLKKGLMQELLTKGIGHKEFKNTEMGRLPKDWEAKILVETAMLERGLSYSGREKSKDEILNGYLFLTLNSIKEGGGLKEDGWTWIKSDRLKERHFVREGDIVIANTDIGMQRGHILGAPAIVNFPEWYKKDKAVFSMDLSKLLFRISNMDVNFLFYYLSFVQPLARKYHTGTNVWHLNLDSWSRDLLIPLPPLEEQKKIAEILTIIDEKLENLRREKTNLERIRQWLMEELLTGRIRVRIA